MEFLKKLLEQRQAALEYIRGVLKQRGTGYEIIDPAMYDEDEGIDDTVYQLPRGVHISKHGHYYEFPIVIIDINDKDELTFKGLDMGDYCEDMDFEESELYDSVVCAIADIVFNLEN